MNTHGVDVWWYHVWSNYKTSTALIMTEIKAINRGKVVGFLDGKMTSKTQMQKFMVLYYWPIKPVITTLSKSLILSSIGNK